MKNYFIKCKSCEAEHTVSTIPLYKDEFLKNFSCNCSSNDVEYFEKEVVKEETGFKNFYLIKDASSMGRVFAKANPDLRDKLMDMKKAHPHGNWGDL